MATQKDVAKELGVAQVTVSRVVNRSPLVNQKTQKKVLAGIKKCGYVLNANARNLVSRQSGTIAILFPSFNEAVNSLYFLPALDGLNDQIAMEGYTILLATTNTWRECRQKLQALLNKVDGVVLFNFANMQPFIGKTAKFLSRNNKRFVVIQSYCGRSKWPYVTIDNIAGAREATKHLVELGHKKIACLGLPYVSPETRDRLKGYSEACKEAGVTVDEQLVFEEIDLNVTSSLGRLFSGGRSDWPTAIFAFSDQIARILIVKCAEHGLRTPQDLSIVGFNDDISFSLMMHPHLTTIRQPLYELGVEAGKMVLHCNDDELTSEPLKLKPKLIVRESSSRISA